MPSRGLAACAGRDEDHRVAVADDDRAVGLLGQLAGLDRQRLLTELDVAFEHTNASARGAQTVRR